MNFLVFSRKKILTSCGIAITYQTLYFISQSLFWSKTGDLVHRYTKSNQNFLTLEDTLLGYMADRVSWCGDPSDPGNLHLNTILFTLFSSDFVYNLNCPIVLKSENNTYFSG